MEECWTRFLSLHLPFFPPPSPFFTLLLANTCVLIPAQPCLLGVIASSLLPPSSFSPCFSTHSCLTNGPHLGEIEPLSVCLPKRSQRRESSRGGFLILHPDLGRACTREITLGYRQAVPHVQYTFTRGMNECLSISSDLSFSLCISFSAVPISLIPPVCPKFPQSPCSSAVLFLVCTSETSEWP